MIAVNHLTKNYVNDGTVTAALRGVSFDIKKGEFVAIMGPSGSGKSTLLHLLSFLDRPTGGEYRFGDRDIVNLSDIEFAALRNKEIGFVFQAFNLLFNSSVYENVELPLLYSDLDRALRVARIAEAVESVGLTDKLQVPAGRLSGGEKQRVAIARALVNDPAVIFADEPTGNLDSKSGARIMEILARLHRDGHTIILVTHETYTAQFAERLIKIRDGVVESDEKIARHRRTQEDFFK